MCVSMTIHCSCDCLVAGGEEADGGEAREKTGEREKGRNCAEGGEKNLPYIALWLFNTQWFC